MKFKKEKSFFVMHLLFFWFLPAFVFAGTAYYVDPNAAGGGNGSFSEPWNSVQQINAKTFVDGDDLYFKVGTTLEMTDRINLRWDGKASDRVIIGAYYGNGQFGLRSGDKRPILRGSYFRDPTGPHVPSGDFDALLQYTIEGGAGYITVQDLEFKESYTGGIKLTNGGSKTVGSHINNIIIRNNIIRDAGGQGIVLVAVHNSIIEKNFTDGTCLRAGRNKKKPNQHSGAAIVIMSMWKSYLSMHNIIRENTLTRGFEMIGVYDGSHRNDVINNIVYDFAEMGIYYTGSRYGTVSGNIIYNPALIFHPPHQADDGGQQNGIQIDCEDHLPHPPYAGGIDVYDNYVANVKRGVLLGSRVAYGGVGHTDTRVFNNRIVDAKIASVALSKGAKDTPGDVEETWDRNYVYDNYSFFYSLPVDGSTVRHVNNNSWPGITWGIEGTRTADGKVVATSTKKGNYYNTDHATVIGNPANNAEFDKVALKKTTGWRDLAPGEVTKSWFEFAGEVLTPKPVAITNLRLE